MRALVLLAMAALGAASAQALECSACTGVPAPVRSSDYLNVQVIGGVKDVYDRLTDLPKWERVRVAMANPAMARDARLAPWIAWAQGLRSLPPSERLNAINQRVNQRVRYQIDQITHGQADVWQNPTETVASQIGDCEDFAILKYYLALHAGFSNADLALVVGRVQSTGEVHAVLVVRSERGFRLLDNRMNNVIDLGGRPDFASIFFVDFERLWVPQQRAGQPARR